MKNLTKFEKLGELAPDAMKAFVAFDEAAFKYGTIPLKHKELMAFAVALTTQCPYCIEIHSKRAKEAGATEQELAETTLVATALRAGDAMTHGTHTLDAGMMDPRRKFELQGKDGAERRTIFAGTTIGEDFSREFPPVAAREVRLGLIEATEGPTIGEISLKG